METIKCNTLLVVDQLELLHIEQELGVAERTRITQLRAQNPHIACQILDHDLQILQQRKAIPHLENIISTAMQITDSPYTLDSMLSVALSIRQSK